MAQIEVDASALSKLSTDIIKAKHALLGRLAERGYQILRKEVPFRTGNLRQGVASPDVDYDEMVAVLTVSARSAAVGSRSADVFDKKGQLKKSVTLRATPSFNYAGTVARGRPKITPKNGMALLIPVYSRPSDEGYLVVGGQIYIVRRSAAAVKADPFDQRTAKQLESEAEHIGEAILKRFFT